jgi:hypothetical protein
VLLGRLGPMDHLMVYETQTCRAEAIVVSLAQCRAFRGSERHLVTPAAARTAVEERPTRRTALLTRDLIRLGSHFFSTAAQFRRTATDFSGS